MKPKKRIVALLLVWNIMIGMLPTVAFADNNSEIQLEEGVTYQDNGDGTATINVFQTPIYEEETNNGEQEGTFLVDSGDVFRSAEGIVDVEFPKAFRQGERIAEVGMMETAIAFIPENAPYEELVEEEQTDFPNSYSVPETEIDYAEKNWSDESLASFAWPDSIDQQDNGENEDLFDYNNDSREADLVTSFENNENQIEEKTSLEEVFENYDAGSIVTENTIDLSTSQEDVVIDEIENMVVPDISVEEVGITSIDNDVWEQNDEDETFVVITSDEKIDDATAEYTENVGDKDLYLGSDGVVTHNAVTYDFTGAWVVANTQYEYFKELDNGYTSFKPVGIKLAKDIPSVIEQYNIQPGDLLYWSKNGGDTVHHATIISTVSENDIGFSGHTTSAFDKSLSLTMSSNGETVFIILMNDYNGDEQ